MASKCVDGPGAGYNFTAMRHAAWNKVFLPGCQADPLSAYDQRITALRDQHVLVVIVGMLGGRGILRARPEGHLAAIYSIENITFNTRSGLLRTSDSVRGMLHEVRKAVHSSGHCLADVRDLSSATHSRTGFRTGDLRKLRFWNPRRRPERGELP